MIEIIIALLVVTVSYLIIAKWIEAKPKDNEPPVVPYTIPFIGSMIEFGMNPLAFLEKNQERYGDCYTFIMFGKKMTYLFGADGNNFVLNQCKLKEVSAEEAYKHLTTPVFGEGVTQCVRVRSFMTCRIMF